MKTYLKDIFEYDDWANKKLIKSLKTQNVNEESVLKLLSHLLLAEQIWMLRLKGGDYKKLDFWKLLSIEECGKISNENYAEYMEFLNSHEDNDYSKTFTYTNSKGTKYTNTIGETITHVALHSAYHRGQAAREVRRLNKVPVLTDYIAFVRERNQ